MKQKGIDSTISEIQLQVPKTIQVRKIKHNNRVYVVYNVEVIPNDDAPTFDQKLLLHGLGVTGNLNLLSTAQAEAIITTAYNHSLKGKVMISI